MNFFELPMPILQAIKWMLIMSCFFWWVRYLINFLTTEKPTITERVLNWLKSLKNKKDEQ